MKCKMILRNLIFVFLSTSLRAGDHRAFELPEAKAETGSGDYRGQKPEPHPLPSGLRENDSLPVQREHSIPGSDPALGYVPARVIEEPVDVVSPGTVAADYLSALDAAAVENVAHPDEGRRLSGPVPASHPVGIDQIKIMEGMIARLKLEQDRAKKGEISSPSVAQLSEKITRLEARIRDIQSQVSAPAGDASIAGEGLPSSSPKVGWWEGRTRNQITSKLWVDGDIRQQAVGIFGDMARQALKDTVNAMRDAQKPSVVLRDLTSKYQIPPQNVADVENFIAKIFDTMTVQKLHSKAMRDATGDPKVDTAPEIDQFRQAKATPRTVVAQSNVQARKKFNELFGEDAVGTKALDEACGNYLRSNDPLLPEIKGAVKQALQNDPTFMSLFNVFAPDVPSASDVQLALVKKRIAFAVKQAVKIIKMVEKVKQPGGGKTDQIDPLDVLRKQFESKTSGIFTTRSSRDAADLSLAIIAELRRAEDTQISAMADTVSPISFALLQQSRSADGLRHILTQIEEAEKALKAVKPLTQRAATERANDLRILDNLRVQIQGSTRTIGLLQGLAEAKRNFEGAMDRFSVQVRFVENAQSLLNGTLSIDQLQAQIRIIDVAMAEITKLPVDRRGDAVEQEAARAKKLQQLTDQKMLYANQLARKQAEEKRLQEGHETGPLLKQIEEIVQTAGASVPLSPTTADEVLEASRARAWEAVEKLTELKISLSPHDADMLLVSARIDAQIALLEKGAQKMEGYLRQRAQAREANRQYAIKHRGPRKNEQAIRLWNEMDRIFSRSKSEELVVMLKNPNALTREHITYILQMGLYPKYYELQEVQIPKEDAFSDLDWEKTWREHDLRNFISQLERLLVEKNQSVITDTLRDLRIDVEQFKNDGQFKPFADLSDTSKKLFRNEAEYEGLVRGMQELSVAQQENDAQGGSNPEERHILLEKQGKVLEGLAGMIYLRKTPQNPWAYQNPWA